jgi:hypothetical protein
MTKEMHLFCFRISAIKSLFMLFKCHGYIFSAEVGRMSNVFISLTMLNDVTNLLNVEENGV